MTTSTNTENTSAIAFEFVIGVTGHRDCKPEDAPALKQQVSAVLAEFAQKFSDLPVRVVTGLAQGADTLVTEVALQLGLNVSAVLPMPREEYEKDFDGKALQQFQKLADDPRISVYELPISDTNEGKTLSDSARVVQYEALMGYLVRRSNLLLALWDGKHLDKTGGTSDVVQSYLSGQANHTNPTKLPKGSEQFENCGDIAVWVNTPRQSAKAKQDPIDTRYLVSDSSGTSYVEMQQIPDEFTNRWQGFDDFAKDRYSDLAEKLTVYPLSEDGDAGMSHDALAIDREFMRADQLAMENQGLSDLLFKGFGLIAAAMGLFFLIYAKLAAIKLYLILYITLFLVGYVLYRIGVKNHWLGRHLAYRALAETIRVQFFLLISGAGEGFSTRRVLSITSVDRFERFEWLQDAVRCTEPLTYSGHADTKTRLQAVKKRWINDQADYFTRKLHSLHQQHGRLEYIKASLLLGSIAGALALILFKKSLIHMGIFGYDGKTWMVFMMGLLPLWLAVWELYQGKMATRELIWQYENQRRHFKAAHQQMTAAENDHTRLRIVSDLAERALTEIYLWSVHRYHREHEPPAAG